MDSFAPNDGDVAISRVFERFQCFFVEGHVRVPGKGWLKAAFTVSKPDVIHMDRDTFMAYCKRQLPSVTEDRPWEHQM